MSQQGTRTISWKRGIVTCINRQNPRNVGQVWTPEGVYQLGVHRGERGTGRHLEPYMWVEFRTPKWNVLQHEPTIYDVPFKAQHVRRPDGSFVLALCGVICPQIRKENEGVKFGSAAAVGYFKMPESLANMNWQSAEVMLHCLERPLPVSMNPAEPASMNPAEQFAYWEVVQYRQSFD